MSIPSGNRAGKKQLEVWPTSPFLFRQNAHRKGNRYIVKKEKRTTILRFYSFTKGLRHNFVLALLALLCARLVYHQYGALWDFIFDLLLTTAYLSVGLGLFNLIPISPLDGSKVLFVFLPDSAYEKLMRYEKYGMIALLILVWLGVGDNVLSTAIYNVYAAMINFVFRGIV